MLLTLTIPDLSQSRFRRAVVCLKDCIENMGYVPNEEELKARKELIELCKKIEGETK